MVGKHCFECTVHPKIKKLTFMLLQTWLTFSSCETWIKIFRKMCVCLAIQWYSTGSNNVLTPFCVLQKKINAYCWILSKSKRAKTYACIQTHVFDLKKVWKIIVSLMSIHLLTKDNHTGGYKIWYQPLKIHTGHTHLSSPRCAAQRVLIMRKQFHFFAVSFHMSL